MPPIDRYYTDVWKGFLRHVLGWPDGQLRRFVNRWSAVEQMEGPYSLTHDRPQRYVVPLSIPRQLRETLRHSGNHALDRLEIRLEKIVMEEFPARKDAEDVDWGHVRREILNALAEFGYELPDPQESFSYWHEHRAPSLNRGHRDGDEGTSR